MIINNIQELQKKLFQNRNKKVVFTNGCFDIIHAGHVKYLKEAKTKGDILIIGINSDSSIKKLKGPKRPINSLENRQIVLDALKPVDYVIPFNEETPYNLIKQIIPDVLVKGGDWSINQIVGADIVLANQGKVLSLSFKEGFSTTNIIKKIKETYCFGKK